MSLKGINIPAQPYGLFNPYPDPIDPAPFSLYVKRTVIGLVASSGGAAFSAAVTYALVLPFYYISGLITAFVLPKAGINDACSCTVLAVMMGLWYAYWLFFLKWSPCELQNIPEGPPANRKRVAVIGGGTSGIVSLKELLEEGHEVVLYEKNSKTGGVWAVNDEGESSSGSAWDATVSSTSGINTGWSDYPLPIGWPGEQFPFHVTQRDYVAYIYAYIEHFHLSASIITKAKVVNMVKNGEGWRLSVSVEGDEPFDEDFDFIVIATGLVEKPRLPQYPGLDECECVMDHSNHYRGPDKYRGKKVLIVGCGETASDACNEVGHVASQAWMSIRGNTLVLPRELYGYPPDYEESRLLYSGPQFQRWALLKLTLPALFTFNSNPAAFMFIIAHNNPLARFPAVCSVVNTTKSDNMFIAINKGLVALKPEIARYNRRGVTFKDGTSIDNVDNILFTTGYVKKILQFYTPPGHEDGYALECYTKLYKTVWHPDLPNTAFVGLSRGLIGAIPMATEMQARWISLVVSGKRQVPNADEMRKRIAYAKRNFIGSQSTRSNMSYTNHLARYEIGCEPKLLPLFFESPSLWYRVLGACMNGYSYRLNGYKAKPAIAKEILQYARVLHFVYNPVLLLQSPLWDLYNLIFPGVHMLETGLDLWA